MSDNDKKAPLAPHQVQDKPLTRLESNEMNAVEPLGLDTLAIRSGHQRTAEGEHCEPIFTTSSYVFPSAAEAAKRFAGEEPGNVYSRYTNPTIRTFQDRIAALEGAEAAVATASGMAAILSTCMALLSAGDHIVCSKSVFGTTTVLLTKYLHKMGVNTTFVSPTNLEAWEQAITPATRLLFVETPSNPICEIVDLARLSDLAHQSDCLLVVDNCFCTPALQRPLALGADIVVHSATKYLDGQGRCMGGVVVGNQALMDEVLAFLRTAGPTLSPFNAWVFTKGLETLRLRMDAHSASALKVAHWLDQQPGVEKVFYAGLPQHPGHALAAKQQRAFGGVLSFRVKTAEGETFSGLSDQLGPHLNDASHAKLRESAWRFIDATRIMSLTANLGDAKTTIVHPATTTHGRLSKEEKLQSHISENLIRVAVGLESVDDLIADLKRGLAAL